MRTWRAAIWCALVERNVEVEFVAEGIPVLGNPSGVRSCSAFGPQTAVACPRRCLDPAFRRQWQPLLPARAGWETGG